MRPSSKKCHSSSNMTVPKAMRNTAREAASTGRLKRTLSRSRPAFVWLDMADIAVKNRAAPATGVSGGQCLAGSAHAGDVEHRVGAGAHDTSEVVRLGGTGWEAEVGVRVVLVVRESPTLGNYERR